MSFAPPSCSLFFKQEMELSLIGLQNAGKTSLVNVIAVSTCIYKRHYIFLYVLFLPILVWCWWLSFCLWIFKTGGYSEDMIPTVCHLSWWIFPRPSYINEYSGKKKMEVKKKKKKEWRRVPCYYFPFDISDFT